MTRTDEQRDEVSAAQVRRRMLNVARLDGPRHANQYVPALNFLRAADDNGVQVADEAEATKLLGELLEWGLLEEAGGLDLGGTRQAFRHRRFRLSKKGFALWSQQIDPIPGVADERFGD